MRYDFIIFGGTGLQGRICTRDLIESGYSVLLVGRDPSGIQPLLKNKKAGFLKADLKNEKEILKTIRYSNADVVINCAELTFNVDIMNACLEAKKSCTDLGGLQKVTEKQFKLHEKFKKAGILNITGCGSTPGILNVLTAHVLEDFDSVETINLGFAWDSNLKKFIIPYSIQSIFDEFTEPPVVYDNGKFVKSNRIRCVDTKNFKEIGQQRVYCIVHSEVYSFVKYFKNKGLKNVHYLAGFPDHSLSAIRTLMDLGFGSQDDIEVNGIKIKPLEFTIRLLKRIPIPEGYNEVENLWVSIEGIKSGKSKKTDINCIVKTIKGWEDAGSNVDTGRTISIMSQMLKEGKITETGVHAPEGVIPHREFIKELGRRQMYVYINGKRIN